MVFDDGKPVIVLMGSISKMRSGNAHLFPFSYYMYVENEYVRC